MAHKKCPTCGALYPVHYQNCPRCDFFRCRDHAQLQSCTGVKYPCSFNCRPCYFETVYKTDSSS